MKRSNMPCSVCGKIKNELRGKKSALFENTTLFLCTDCYTYGKEPRAYIVIIARSNPGRVEDYVKNHRYAGDEITLKDTLN